MCKKIRKVPFMIAALFMLTSLSGCSKDNLTLSGRLLLPMAKQNDTMGIYSMNLNDNGDIAKVFDDKQYSEIKYPSASEIGMLCVGYSETGTYSILNITGDKAEILYQGENKISYPQYYDENCILFIMEDETDTAYLYCYDLENGSLDKIYDSMVDIESRPVLSNDGCILFVAESKNIDEEQKKKSSFTIMQIDENKEVKQIIQGRFANWLNGGRQIIYDKGGSLYTYDIDSSKSIRFKKGINTLCTPVLIGDSDVIAFYQGYAIEGFSSVEMPFLTIINISSGREIKTNLWGAVSKSNISSISLEGLDWVEK